VPSVQIEDEVESIADESSEEDPEQELGEY
jgi:hypothetical protein